MPTARCIAVWLCPRAWFRVLLLGVCGTLSLPGRGAKAQAMDQTEVAATLSGVVVDASGKPIAGAKVSAQGAKGSTALRLNTDEAGAFRLSALNAGTYTLRAEKQGTASEGLPVTVARGSHQDVRIVLGVDRPSEIAGSTKAGEAMDFVDKPTFTVAGVTDWTAVGGHGSDATLRTSEELNRETLALRAVQPATMHSGGGKADEEYQMALALQASGDFSGAKLHVKQALALRDAGDFHRLAGELEEKLGNPLAAVGEEQRATQLDPSEENYFAWGSELLLHRAVWQAAEVFANAAKAYPVSARVKTAWGAALFAGALYDEAAEKICAASDLDPSAREPYVFAGRIAVASPSANACIAQKLQRFLAQRPNDSEANYLYAMFLLKHGTASDGERVRQLLSRAVALDPKCSDGYLQLGILSASRKDYQGAIRFYRKALEADPRMGEAHYRLGIAYDRTGDSAKAREEYALHEQIVATDAALVEKQRREVKQFSVVTSSQPATAESP